MFDTKKVLWKEGLYLQPQHFQQQERYFINAIHKRFNSLLRWGYGFTDYSIDSDAVSNGKFFLKHAEGILPDGTVFSVGRQNKAPAIRVFENYFSHDRQFLDVHFALPIAREYRVNSSSTTDTTAGVRYCSIEMPVVDEVYGSLQKPIELGDLNTMILFGDESRDNCTSMPVARLQRNENGEVKLDNAFIPPILYIGCSPVLLQSIGSLLELIYARIRSLSQGRKSMNGKGASFSSKEMTALHLLNILNTYAPLLHHCHAASSVHPYELYTYFLPFTGSLCTFSSDISIGDLPAYIHENITEVFGVFDRIIRQILGMDISSDCQTVAITQISPARYGCQITNPALFSQSSFYLGISADISEKELIVNALTRIKMCSQNKLELLIPSAMPGLPLFHVVHPPEELPTKPSYIYLKLDQKNELWDDIKESGTIAFYFPNRLPDLCMELLVLK